MPKLDTTPAAPANPSGSARGSSRPLTLLEFLLAECYGPPKHISNEVGVSYWDCPVCGADAFHSVPDEPNEKHRAYCWHKGCDFGGDGYDILKHRYPHEGWHNSEGGRIYRMEQIEQRYAEYKRGLALHGGAGSYGVTP